MRQMDFEIPAGQAVEFGAVGDYVRIKSASVAVRVEAPDNGEFLDLEEGDSANLTRFNRLRISTQSASAQDVIILIGNGTTADSAKVGGAISIVGAAIPMASSQKTVTNASGTLAAANASRKLLIVQNNDASGVIYVNLSGAAATAANGVKIPAGGVLLLDSVVPSGAVTAIGSIASNSNVVVVEG